MAKETAIKISKRGKIILRKMKRKGETFEDVINRLKRERGNRK